MDIIIDEIKKHNIDVGENSLEIAIKECMEFHDKLLHDLKKNVKTFLDFEEIYKNIEKYEIGQIISFYSLIIIYYEEK